MAHYNLDTILQQPIVVQVLGWILFGLLVGVVAKVLLPGPENMGWIRTILVGIFGSFLGGFLGHYFGVAGAAGMGWNIPGFLTAVAGAFVLVVINRLVTRS
jgi:uncharacterized membrane protein YeaQ/YmgE (transglycosylase-associated protein family)